MTYYEELGVPRNASTLEIRQAYKVLARLVHPDGQADQQVRVMADRQMMRLNELLTTLTDPQKRRDYDESLLFLSGTVTGPAAHAAMTRRKPAVVLRPEPEPWRTRIPEWADGILAYWFWIALAAMILGVGCWYVAADKSAPAAETNPKAPVVNDSHSPAPPGSGAAPHRAKATSFEAPPPSSAEAPEPSPESPQPATPEAPPNSGAAAKETARIVPAPVPESPATASLSAKPELADALTQPQSAAPSFSGNWFFVPDSVGPLTPGAYAATYMEFLLTEDHGNLSGSYRARYKVPNLAVSPEVFFQAQGRIPPVGSAKLNWISPDGARGVVELTLLGRNGMNVAWWTTQSGPIAALASGTARLIRQQVR